MLDTLFDPVRGISVPAFAEEKVRQALLSKMIEELGYPKSLLGVEKKLDQFPHLANQTFSSYDRRVDIVCFAKEIHPEHALYPLLVIECKAMELTEAVIEQVLGYNHFIKAYFTAIAGPSEFFLFWYENQKRKSLAFLPTFEQLLLAVKKNG